MRILQLNIWHGRLGAQVVEVLNREKPDVVCLQEVVEFKDGKCFLLDNLEKILEQTGYEHCFFTPHLAFNLMKRRARWGLATLSTIPFVATNATFTRLEYVDDFDFIDTDYNIRGIQHVTVVWNGQSLNILNHHGHHIPNHKNGDEETMRQCKIIVDYIQKLNGPVVLCGDFNLAPNSESLAQINTILVNHVKDKGIVTTRTALTHKTEVCDYIFTSPDIVIKDFQVLDDIASDHKALTVTL